MSENSASPGAMWRILCIDDEPDVLEILKITLGTKHEVVTAYNGLEAMSMLDLSDPDFILCDIRMPKMDGFQTVEAIRRHPRFHDIPVFFLTAEHGGDKAKRGFAVGANLYLTKPFDPMRVLQNIDYFLKEHGRRPRTKRLTPREVEKEVQRLSAPEAEPAPETAEAPAAEAAKIDPQKVRIIIICHDTNQLDRFHSALKEKYECVACADPLASIQQLFRYDPDILVINPAVPKLSGWGMVQMIRGNKKLKTLPILLVDDPGKPMDPRLIPAVTKFPILSPNSPGGEILEAVEKVVASKEFFIRPKRAAIKELAEEEAKLRKSLVAEETRRLRQEESLRKRYSRIQEFINSNM